MKRRVFALVSLLILMLTMTAHAIEPYGAVQMPILSFNGTTANCYVDCKGENSTDTVKATLTPTRVKLMSIPGAALGKVMLWLREIAQ